MEELLEKTGFTKEEQQEFLRYRQQAGEEPAAIAKAYMIDGLDFSDALARVQKLQTDRLHVYTLNLLFLLECSGYLHKKYQEAGLKEEVFVGSMKDFKYKLDECRQVKGVFGIFVPEWYRGFLELRRFGLGRLQYDISAYDRETITIAGYTIEEGAFMLYCHIPSSGPLKPELCLESFKQAYQMFQDRLKDGILVIKCVSWLLYEPYQPIFGEKSNTVDFAKNFFIVSSRELEEFTVGWRIFGKEYDGDLSKLPTKTRLQRGMIDYIKKGGKVGDSSGVLLFDGERVLTKRA